MRILLVGNFLKDLRFGAPKVLLKLGEEFQRCGHHVDFIFRDEMPQIFSKERWSYLAFPLYILKKIREREREGCRYDIIDISSGDGFLITQLRSFFRSEYRYICRSHGLEHLDWEQKIEEERRGRIKISAKHKLWFMFVRMNQVRHAIRSCDHAIFICSSDREYVVKRGWAHRHKTSVIHHGVSPIYFHPQKTSRGRGLLYVGSWIPRKGIHYLREAFEMLLKRFPDVRLSLIGVRMDADRALWDFSVSARQNIRVIPLMTEDDLIGEYSGHDILLFPSLYEGFGLVLLEAMACGLAVVATDTGGAPDLIQDGVNGVIVQRRDSQGLADRIQRLLEDHDLRQRLGENARKTASEYTWEVAARKTLVCYENALMGERGLRTFDLEDRRP